MAVSITLPTVGGDNNTWGPELNIAIQTVADAVSPLGWFHLNDYGADPTGTNFSDTAVTAWLADLNAAGGVGYLDGTYKIANSIVISHDNVVLRGNAMGASLINYTGSGAAIKTDNAAIRRAGGIEFLKVSCTTSGATALLLDNAYRWICYKSKFESQGGTTGVAVDIVGSGSKSTYLNEFHSCDAWGSLASYRLNNNVNGTRWFGGVTEGPGYGFHFVGTTLTMGTNTAFGVAVQNEGTNTSGVIIQLGTAGSGIQCSYNAFIGCRIESAGATSIKNEADSWYNIISGGSIAGTTTITDNVTTTGAGLSVFVPSSAINWHFGRPIDSDSFEAGKGKTNATTVKEGSVQATGTGTDVNVNLRSKGAGAVAVNAFTNDGTAGLIIYDGGSSPAARTQMGNSSIPITLFPASGNYALRIFKSGDSGYRVRWLDTGKIFFGDGAGVYDCELSRLATGVLGTNVPFRVQAAATGSRPSAATVGAGAMMFDTTLGIPIWSNGTNWVNSVGTTV